MTDAELKVRLQALIDTFVQEERAAVVAWLRDCSSRCREWDGRELAVSATYRLAAAVIERGEHRREEKA